MLCHFNSVKSLPALIEHLVKAFNIPFGHIVVTIIEGEMQKPFPAITIDDLVLEVAAHNPALIRTDRHFSCEPRSIAIDLEDGRVTQIDLSIEAGRKDWHDQHITSLNKCILFL